jgi:phenylpropionate dioxygenase-like ring-hydroxylating dioxygenase large terminal subunit
MYINFWYPAARSAAVQDKPLRVRMLGLNFVVWRDGTGLARVMSNTCVHRGASLGHGWCNRNRNTVVCPYHGWEFAAGGKCVHLPSLARETDIPASAKVDSYPVQAKSGLIFAFLGDLPREERPPMVAITEYDQAGWRHNEDTPMLELNFSTERSIENGLDPSHNEFVHPTLSFSGRNPDYHLDPLQPVQDGQWGSHFRRVYPLSALDVQTGQGGGRVEVTGGHWGPNALITRIHPGEQQWVHLYLFQTPIDERRTRIYFVSTRNFLLDEDIDLRMIERNLAVVQEDVDVLKHIEPAATPAANGKEILVPADAPIMKYREILKGFESRGWKIDTAKIRSTGQDTVYAVPCPARRREENWVLDSVPLVPPAPAG